MCAARIGLGLPHLVRFVVQSLQAAPVAARAVDNAGILDALTRWQQAPKLLQLIFAEKWGHAAAHQLRNVSSDSISWVETKFA